MCCSVLQYVAVCAFSAWSYYTAGEWRVVVCCRVLQCALFLCDPTILQVLQCLTVCCSVLQRVLFRVVLLYCRCVVCCVVLQCVAACCSVLQCVAACCSVLQCVLSVWSYYTAGVWYVAMCCMVLQCIAVCGSVLFLCALSVWYHYIVGG